MDIGLKIKSLRKERKFSVEDLAARIEVSRQTVYDYESGRIKPSSDKIQLLADVFSVPSAELKSLVSDKKSEVQNSASWFQKLVDDLQEEKRRLMDQNERLTRLLELHLGKCEGCPFSTAEVPVFEISTNRESVKESVHEKPARKAA